jgi:hypothetical protein
MVPPTTDKICFLEICGKARKKLADGGCIDPADEDLFCMFQIIVLNFAYCAFKYPSSKAFIQKSIGMGFLFADYCRSRALMIRRAFMLV